MEEREDKGGMNEVLLCVTVVLLLFCIANCKVCMLCSLI
jgi:hypothetical protein